MAPRCNGYDDEFDYAGRDYVAAPAYLRGFGKRQPRDAAQRTGARSAGDAASALVDGLQARAGGTSASARAMGVWRKLSDKRVRLHVLGLYLREGRGGVRELIAYVDNPLWVHEFSLRAPMVLPEWNFLCRENGLDMQANKLTFKLSSRAYATDGSRGLSDPDGGRQGLLGAVSPLRPLSESDKAAIARATSVITNDKLRKAAYNAMTKTIQRQKSTPSENGA